MNYYPEQLVWMLLAGGAVFAFVLGYVIGRCFARAERRRRDSRPLMLPLYPNTEITRARKPSAFSAQ